MRIYTSGKDHSHQSVVAAHVAAACKPHHQSLLDHLGGDRPVVYRTLGQRLRSTRLALIVGQIGPVEVIQCLAQGRDEALRLVLAQVNLHQAPGVDDKPYASRLPDGVSGGFQRGHVAPQGNDPVDFTAPPPPRNENRVATHDGHIWPQPRQRMTDARAIRRRMAEEVRAEINRAGADATISIDDFRRRGWTDGQINLHAPAAIDAATAGKRRDAA